MREQAMAFGPGENMVGVLTEPDTPTKAPPLVVFNSGFIHRVGPGRLAVDIARRAAEVGISTLRFDFSGIGDSAPRVPPLDPIAGGIADARVALDHLSAAHGAQKFILLGLCSGARHAYHVALAEPRVVGTVMLDGYAFPTVRSRAMDVRERLEEPRALVAGALRRAKRLLDGQQVSPPTAFDREGFFPEDVTKPQMAKDMRTLVDRGVRMLNIYTGEWRTYRYEGQLQDVFPEVPIRDAVTEHLIETADHLYSTPPERASMLGILSTWLRQRFA